MSKEVDAVRAKYEMALKETMDAMCRELSAVVPATGASTAHITLDVEVLERTGVDHKLGTLYCTRAAIEVDLKFRKW